MCDRDVGRGEDGVHLQHPQQHLPNPHSAPGLGLCTRLERDWPVPSLTHRGPETTGQETSRLLWEGRLDPAPLLASRPLPDCPGPRSAAATPLRGPLLPGAPASPLPPATGLGLRLWLEAQTLWGHPAAQIGRRGPARPLSSSSSPEAACRQTGTLSTASPGSARPPSGCSRPCPGRLLAGRTAVRPDGPPRGCGWCLTAFYWKNTG